MSAEPRGRAAAVAAAVEALREMEPEERQEARKRVQRERWRRLSMDFEAPGSFAAFVRWAWPLADPSPLEWAPYLDVVCAALHRQMQGHPWYRRLLVLLPPGYGKSLLVSVFAPAYEWLHEPSRRKLFFTANDDLSTRDSRRTRRVICSPEYRELMTQVAARDGRAPWDLTRDQNEKRNFENDRMGFRQCMTLRTGVTGKRGDDLVVDDPIDAKAVILHGPDVIRRRCEEAGAIIDGALETRVNDRRTARQTLVMQRLHPEDPAGRALKEGGWRVLCLPQRYEPDHPQVCPEDPRSEPGELLHPRRDRPADIARLTAKLGWQAAGQLQLRPTTKEGQQFRRSMFRRYAGPPQQQALGARWLWISVDCANEAHSQAAMSVINVHAVLSTPEGLRWRILDEERGQWELPELIAAFRSVCARWPRATRKLVEYAAAGIQLVQVVGREIPGIEPVKPRGDRDYPGGDKETRAQYTLQCLRSGVGPELPEDQYALGADGTSWAEGTIQEHCAFPGGRLKDRVDTCSQVAVRILVDAAGRLTDDEVVSLFQDETGTGGRPETAPLVYSDW